MVTFTQAQWQQLGQSSFNSRLVRILRQQLPEHTSGFTDEQLTAPVPELVRRAQGYGLKDEQSAALFVLNAFMLGLRFDERVPSLSKILNEPKLSPGTKANALTDFTVTVFHELDRAARAKAAT